MPIEDLLAKQLLPDTPSQLVGRRRGAVITWNSAAQTVDVALGTTTIPGVKYLASYQPTAGDTVFVDFTGSDPLVLGRTSSNAEGQFPNGMTVPWIELRSTTGDTYVDFTRTPGTGDFNMRLINNASERLTIYSSAGSQWGSLWVGSSKIGSYAWNGAIAAFGHHDVMDVDSTSYAVLHEPDGSLDLNSKGTAHQIRLRIDGTDKMLVGTSGTVHYDWVRCNTSGVGIYFTPGGGGFYQNNGDGWIYTYADKPIYTGGEIRAKDACMKTWAGGADHAVFQHRNRSGVAGEGYGFLQRWDGYCWISSTGTINFNVGGGSSRCQIDNADPIVVFKGTDRFGNGDCHRFWADGECWHYSVGIGGDNGDNAGLKLTVGKGEFYRFDQLGNWDINPLWTSSAGGGSGARITHRAAGQNAAPMWKSWGQAFEARSWDDGGFIPIRGLIENYCRAEGKTSIKDAKVRLPKAARKQKIKNLRTVHYNRTDKGKGCPNCVGTGKATENRRIADAVAIKAKRKERGQPLHDLPPHILDVEEPSEGERCPDCGGLGIEWRRPEDTQSEADGWFGFVVEEVVQQFPEATFYRHDEDGVIRPSGVDHMALIALLWEEVKDLEDRLVAVEGKGK